MAWALNHAFFNEGHASAPFFSLRPTAFCPDRIPVDSNLRLICRYCSEA